MAGVSRTVVSLVINGRADRYGIAKATQARVLSAVQALGYTPNMTLRNICLNNRELIAAGVNLQVTLVAPAAEAEEKASSFARPTVDEAEGGNLEPEVQPSTPNAEPASPEQPAPVPPPAPTPVSAQPQPPNAEPGTPSPDVPPVTPNPTPVQPSTMNEELRTAEPVPTPEPVPPAPSPEPETVSPPESTLVDAPEPPPEPVPDPAQPQTPNTEPGTS